MDEFEIFRQLLASVDSEDLPAPPAEISLRLATAKSRVVALEEEIKGTQFQEYFKVSTERYAHYLAAADLVLSENSSVLDIGNAPGHVGMLFHRLGHVVKGINLNANWRTTYKSPEWLETFSVQEVDIEKQALPFENNAFDAVLFTEVLEHIAIRNPSIILTEMRRVLRPGGVIIFSTPNVCNISNIYALLHGRNVFWPQEMFYGSLDRHNREYTPKEVYTLLESAGFQVRLFWGMNDHGNWRAGGNEFTYAFTAEMGTDHSCLRNTIVGVFVKDEP
jgi:2-polyprenyl-3-methyl-5-hydroxy-6-metoxy-1,4-benzoquinol methylase